MTGRGAPLFELEDAAIAGPRGKVLDELTWRIRDRAISVLLGPAGIGKSLTLRSLAGERLPVGWTATGAWRHRGRPIVPGRRPPGVAWCPQRGAHRLGVETNPGAGCDWRDVVGTGANAVLLDEPERGASAQERDELVAALERCREDGAAVVITHDLRFARRVADHVCLFVAGGIAAATDARTFFEQPPCDLVRRFLEQGNCWPPGPLPPQLPSHFRWILPEGLAGMGRPGLLGAEETDLEAIAVAGVELLVSLTREPVPVDRLRGFGIQGRHFPIKDMGVPAVRNAARLCAEIHRRIEGGSAVALHCHAGLGRTGTMLAAYLVWTGSTAEEAIRRVRQASPKYIQSDAQLEFIRRFAEET